MKRILFLSFMVTLIFKSLTLSSEIITQPATWDIKTSVSGYFQARFENSQKDYTTIKESLSSFNISRMRVNVKSVISQNVSLAFSFELASLLRKKVEDTSATQSVLLRDAYLEKK